MKKYISCLLVLLALLLPGLAVEANAAEIVDSGVCGEYVSWSLDSSGTMTISGVGDMWDGDIFAESLWSSDVRKIIVEPGVTSIGSCAFRRFSDLTSVSIAEGVTKIGDSAFCDCYDLETVILPDSLTTISDSAFNSCISLRRIEIPKGVTKIGNYAFGGCERLMYAAVPGGITSIAESLFAGCSNLADIILPQSVAEIAGSAFENCTNLTAVHYNGSANQWGLISIASGNDPLRNAILYTNETPFTDVSSADYYYTPVCWAVERNIAKGMAAAAFAPDRECTRSQIVTFLWRANGSPEPVSGRNPFSDIPADQWYTDAVLWAVEKGIAAGTSQTTFSPDAACTRGQVATFLWRAAGKPASGAANCFYDVAYDAYYYNAILWAVEKGITNGVEEGIFAPDAPCTRGQIVTFLYRAEERSPQEKRNQVQYGHRLVDVSFYNYYEGRLRILYTYDKIMVLDQTDATKKINSVINRNVAEFFSRLSAEDLEQYADSPWLGESDYFWYTAESEVTNNSNGIFSICVTTDWMMGGVRNQDYYGLTFDMNTGEEPNLAARLGMTEEDLTRKLKDITWAYLTREYQGDLFAEAWDKLSGYAYDDFMYYVRDMELILTFPTYAFACGAAGAFTVPTGLYVS